MLVEICIFIGNSSFHVIFSPIQLEDGTKLAAAIICSSGTTGPQKGVCLSHAMLADAIFSNTQSSGNDVVLCYSSIFWLSGLGTLLAGTFNDSTRLITTKRFTAELFFQMVEKYKVMTTMYIFLTNSGTPNSIFLCQFFRYPLHWAHPIKWAWW